MKKRRMIDAFLCIVIAGSLTGLLQPRMMEQIHAKQEANKIALEQVAVQTKSMLKGSVEVVESSQINYPNVGDSYAIIRNDDRGFYKELYFGDSNPILDKAIGQYSKSGIPGLGKPLLIAGHNGTHFNKLPSFEIGDHVYIDTSYGTFAYEIYDSEIKNASDFDVSILDKEEELMILYTCYPFDTVITKQRYFVYAKKVSGPVIMEDGSWQE